MQRPVVDPRLQLPSLRRLSPQVLVVLVGGWLLMAMVPPPVVRALLVCPECSAGAARVVLLFFQVGAVLAVPTLPVRPVVKVVPLPPVVRPPAVPWPAPLRPWMVSVLTPLLALQGGLTAWIPSPPLLLPLPLLPLPVGLPLPVEPVALPLLPGAS